MKHLLATALLFSGAASAATVNIAWTNPITNTDRSTIPATGAGSLTQARVEYGTCSGTAFGTSLGNVTRTQPVSTASLTLEPGTYCVRVFVTNTYGNESLASNVATKVIPAPTPDPATNLRFTDPVVFNTRPSAGGLVLAQRVGLVRPRAEPVRAVLVNGVEGYCQVARSDVFGRGKPRGVLVAKCAQV